MTPAGFPHSDISGSTPACDSPKLFAANHVLHRLLTPRHSPCALSSLVTNLKTIDASLLSLSRYAVYKVEYTRCSELLVNPLTLDCFIRNRSCGRFERCTQDTLSRRRCLLDCQRAIHPESRSTRGEGRESYRNPALRQESLGWVERKGFEPSTPGLQSRCSPS